MGSSLLSQWRHSDTAIPHILYRAVQRDCWSDACVASLIPVPRGVMLCWFCTVCSTVVVVTCLFAAEQGEQSVLGEFGSRGGVMVSAVT